MEKVEGLLREQLNKRKPDDEFADIKLGHFGLDGNLNIVFLSGIAQRSNHVEAAVEVLMMLAAPEATRI